MNTLIQKTVHRIAGVIQQEYSDEPLSKREILEIAILLNFELLKRNGHANEKR